MGNRYFSLNNVNVALTKLQNYTLYRSWVIVIHVFQLGNFLFLQVAHEI